MANLLDTIRKNSAPQEQQMGDETGKLATLLRARSGKSVAGPAVGPSSLGEAAAVNATNQQVRNVQAPAVARQNDALALDAEGLAQKEQQQTAEIAQSRRANTLQSQIQTQELLQNLEQGKGKIDMAREKAAVDQLAVNLRMGTQKYVDDVKRIGGERRLKDGLAFEQELTQTTFGDQQRIAEQMLKNKSVLSASDREFDKALGSMSVDQAWETFNAQMAADKQKALYSGIGGLATAGIGAYGTAQDSSARSKASGGES